MLVQAFLKSYLAFLESVCEFWSQTETFSSLVGSLSIIPVQLSLLYIEALCLKSAEKLIFHSAEVMRNLIAHGINDFSSLALSVADGTRCDTSRIANANCPSKSPCSTKT